MDVLGRIYNNRYKNIPKNDEEAYRFLLDEGETRDSITGKVESVLRMMYLNDEQDLRDTELVKEFNKEELKGHRVMPIHQTSDTVYFVVNRMKDQKLRDTAKQLARQLGKDKYNIDKFVLNFEFDELVETFHRGISKDEYVELKRKNVDILKSRSRTFEDGFEIEDVYDGILHRGFDNRATDIHIEPLKQGMQVRYRIDGMMGIIDPYDISQDQVNNVITRFKVQSAMRIEQKREGQDSRLSEIKHRGKVYDLRLSTIPTVLGEKIAIRVLEKDEKVADLKELGFSKFYINALKRDMARNQGLILNTGSVGSGKTTTSLSLLNSLNAKELNIYSVEDPVEKTIPFVNHIDVRATGVSFGKHLKALLRQDPNVINIGEIRESEELNIAVKAALSGQLVFSTVHTNSSLEAFQKFFNLGVPPYELGAALVGIGSQRLVRTLCPYCKEKREVTQSERLAISGIFDKYSKYDQFRGGEDKRFEYVHEAHGCSHCNHTGYHGRTVVAEYLSVNDQLKSYIAEGQVTREGLLSIALLDDSFVPIEIDALNKVMLGTTTVSEIKRVT